MNPKDIIEESQVCLYSIQIEDKYVTPSIKTKNVGYVFGDIAYSGILSLETSDDNITFFNVQTTEVKEGVFGFEYICSNIFLRLHYKGESNQITIFLNTS